MRIFLQFRIGKSAFQRRMISQQRQQLAVGRQVRTNFKSSLRPLTSDSALKACGRNLVGPTNRIFV